MWGGGGPQEYDTDASTHLHLQNSSNTAHFKMVQRTKINIKGMFIECEGVDWIQQAQDRPVVGSCKHMY
jgi:hypothetical protein